MVVCMGQEELMLALPLEKALPPEQVYIRLCVWVCFRNKLPWRPWRLHGGGIEQGDIAACKAGLGKAFWLKWACLGVCLEAPQNLGFLNDFRQVSTWIATEDLNQSIKDPWREFWSTRLPYSSPGLPPTGIDFKKNSIARMILCDPSQDTILIWIKRNFGKWERGVSGIWFEDSVRSREGGEALNDTVCTATESHTGKRATVKESSMLLKESRPSSDFKQTQTQDGRRGT